MRKTKERGSELDFLLRMQCVMPFIDDVREVVKLNNNDVVQCLSLFAYGYIQGKRAERARRKKGGKL